MASGVEDLEAALVAAFPPVAIDRDLIDEPTSNWTVYDDHAGLAAFEGKTWRDCIDVLVRHPTLPVYAGDGLWRASLPGYLLHLLHERRRFDDLPFQVASQLARPASSEGQPKFERRIAPLSHAQRSIIRDVLAVLSTVPPMDEAMAHALATWDDLSRRAGGPEGRRP